MKHGRILQVFGLVLVASSTSWAQVTRRISVNTSGGQSNGLSDYSAISGDGRFVAFRSYSSNLVGGDTNGFRDVFYRGLVSSQTRIASVDSNEVEGNQASGPQSFSGDGGYVAFSSNASNLVAGDTNGQMDVFVRDLVAGTTERVSLSTAGVQGNGPSFNASISGDGRYVVFQSSATNLVSNDTNGVDDIFLRDRVSGTTFRVSLDTIGMQSNGPSESPAISADGNWVAFASGATNLVGGDTNGAYDVFRCGRTGGSMTRISIDPAHASEGNGHSLSPTISADGSCIAFFTLATNLGHVIDTNGVQDVICRDLNSNTIELVSQDPGGAVGNGSSGVASISGDGTYVAFESEATNLVSGDTNGTRDIFVRNRALGTTERVSIATSGAEGNGTSSWPSISADGRYVAFESDATNLVPGDTNGTLDIFLRDRDATGFTSICRPGLDGALACPCSNPPTIQGRGCNNSAATGGALLTASGAAYLSADSLVFTTFAEKPTALSVLLQGDALTFPGVVYGQGVRCVGGHLERLFSRNASGGSVTLPNLGGGDSAVSARSAAKGDVIQPGEIRWYLVYYRDPTVVGGCPASRTFNATQTGRVSWSP